MSRIMTTYTKLLAKREAINMQLEEARKEELVIVWGELDNILSEYEVSKKEFLEYVSLRKALKKPSGRFLKNTPMVKKIPPKYTDGINFWSGRGLKANFIKEAIANGKTLDDLLIKS